jgi:hypothetical protein
MNQTKGTTSWACRSSSRSGVERRAKADGISVNQFVATAEARRIWTQPPSLPNGVRVQGIRPGDAPQRRRARARTTPSQTANAHTDAGLAVGDKANHGSRCHHQ